MPSPFPGFVPYLESPRYWRDFHVSYLYALRAELMRRLPPGFAARIEECLIISQQARSIYPDIALVHDPVSPQAGLPVAFLDRPLSRDEPITVTLMNMPLPERFVEVFLVNAPGEVVTTIELLSPANKPPGRQGQDAYLHKQEQLLQSDVNLMEIDLLRAGMHTVAVERTLILKGRDEREWDYLICLHRASKHTFEAWPSTVHDPMPIISVPLTEKYPDVIVDLRAPFDRVYDEAVYPRFVDYSGEADPPLSAADAQWADGLLRAAGFRSVPVSGSITS